MNNDNTGISDRITELEKRVKKLEDRVLTSVGNDVLLESAIKLTHEYEMVSASLLQRRLSIGYARASSILDQLEKLGILGPGTGSRPRKVLNK